MQLTDVIIEGIQNIKGKRIINIDLSKIENSICSNFIICEGSSNTHVSAIADSVSKHVKSVAKTKALGKDGADEAQWIILDYGNVMVHIFQRATRDYYDLEGLWADGIVHLIEDLD